MREESPVGDPMNKATQMGPQVSEEQLNRIKGYSTSRVKKVRRFSPAAARHQLEGRFRRVTSSAHDLLGRQEQDARGPGRDLRPSSLSDQFKDEDDLLKQANDTIYGLSAGIWTRDITRAHRFARDQGRCYLD
jgi:acyl-CoA reductase-like NAD-dependent aldehyde dehydrogenase